MEAVLRLQ